MAGQRKRDPASHRSLGRGEGLSLIVMGGRVNPRVRGASPIGQAPARAPEPAVVVGHVVVPVEPRHLVEAAAGESLGKRAFGLLVARTGAGDDGDAGDPLGEIVAALLFD